MKWSELQAGDAVLRGNDTYVVISRAEQCNPIGPTLVSVKWLSSKGVTEGYVNHEVVPSDYVVIKKDDESIEYIPT